MPMELYTSEAFVRDIVNAISRSEGKPLNIGGSDQHGIERDYAFLLISQAKRAVEGNAGSEGSKPAGKAAPSRSEAIQKLMAKLDRQEATARKRPPARKRAASSARAAKTLPRTVAPRRRRAGRPQR
jgi:hypothetical protein